MSTVTSPRPVAKRSSTTDLSLSLRIGGTMYDVFSLAPGEDHVKAYRLTKIGGSFGDFGVYDVALGHDGQVTCDCPDFVVRHADAGTCCS